MHVLRTAIAWEAIKPIKLIRTYAHNQSVSPRDIVSLNFIIFVIYFLEQSNM